MMAATPEKTCLIVLEGDVLVDLEPAVIPGREESLHLNACEASDVREACPRLVVPEAQLTILVQSTGVQISGGRLHDRVVSAG